MDKLSIYTEDLWARYADKVLSEKKEKTYKHFDNVFDFASQNLKLKKILEDESFHKILKHSFSPFVKILTKTPRYKFDPAIDAFDLETKIRPISFASHFDSYLYGFYSFALTEYYQDYIRKNKFDKAVLAYRSDLGGDCNIQFAKRAFDSVKKMVGKHGRCTAIALDITGYFDNIDHKILKENWCKIIDEKKLPEDQFKIYKSLTQYSYVNNSSLMRHFGFDSDKAENFATLLDIIPKSLISKGFNEKFDLIRKRGLIVKNLPKKDLGGDQYRGIPQGSPMSAVLSNIYLIDFDKWLETRSRYMGSTYLRYCDDLLVICKSEDAIDLTDAIIADINLKYKLTIQSKKTDIIEFWPNSKGIVRGFDIKNGVKTKTYITDEKKTYKNLQYLGFEFNGTNIYIRPSSLSRYFRKAKGRIIKTMMMAYGKKSRGEKIYKKQIYQRYSHFGERNFISYAQNASKDFYLTKSGIIRAGMDSVSIKKQLSAHFSILQKEIEKSSKQFAARKFKKEGIKSTAKI